MRYADDFIITGSSKELLEGEVKPLVEAFLATRGLELSQEKTRITHVAEGFDFLGQRVRKFGTAIIITPSKKNVQAFKAKVKSIFAAQKSARQENLIAQAQPRHPGLGQLSPQPVGVAHDFSQRSTPGCGERLWQWAKRRHPNKSAGWTKVEISGTIGQRQLGVRFTD
ncbi:MAG: reverse transcriptase domain-containing protein [Comamonadaceae bacterium]|nr:reverse transcriptase domain-containing protein [Comamonadaceae bacterium]